jgi:hypothetical protein
MQGLTGGMAPNQFGGSQGPTGQPGGKAPDVWKVPTYVPPPPLKTANPVDIVHEKLPQPRKDLQNYRVKAPAALAPREEGSGPRLYTPPDNRTLPTKDELKKFFPQHEAGGHLGVWGEFSDGQPSGALGFSSKGWEYGAGNPSTEEPEKEDPLKATRGKSEEQKRLEKLNWFNSKGTVLPRLDSYPRRAP